MRGPPATQAKYSTRPTLLCVTVEGFLERRTDIPTFYLVVLNQGRIHTGFHRFTEIGQIFLRGIFLVKKSYATEIFFHNYNMEIVHDKILRFARLH